MKKTVVVTGLGVISSIGIGKDCFWENLIKGASGISEVTAFDTSSHTAHKGAQIKNFNPLEFINSRKAKMMGRTTQLAVCAVRQALEDAGYTPEKLSKKKTAVSMGITLGELPELERMDLLWLRAGKAKIDAGSVYRFISTHITSAVAREFHTRGPNRLFTTACAAGNYAIGYGYDLIQSGEADVVIAGGTDAFAWIPFTGFNQLRSMAWEKCQPFDKNRKGMMLGEGSGALILEPLESALEREASIYAQILGYGLSCDAYHMTNTQAEGILKCMQDALRQTGISADEVDYICAHGTGTRHNDKAESAAIKSLFGDRKIAVSSLKSMLGHAMGAASAIEAVSCCLTIKHDIIPPTINYEIYDPECDIDCVVNQARRCPVNIGLNNGFAFGGNNACVVLKKFKE